MSCILKQSTNVSFIFLAFTLFSGGCTSTPENSSAVKSEEDVSVKTSIIEEDVSFIDKNLPLGTINFTITSVIQEYISGKIELTPVGKEGRLVKESPEGKGSWSVPIGTYIAYISAYDNDLPIVVSIQELSIEENKEYELKAEVLEGVLGERTLRAFDQDFDQVLDRLETEKGTDPFDAASTPGDVIFQWNKSVLSDKSRWYRGDFHTFSEYGGGEESVAKLIRRAEQANLDFLAITDRHSLASAMDKDFKSDSVVLIPGMEWGSNDKGVALLYSPRTMPRIPVNDEEAQRMAIRLQAQGGIFALSSPCHPNSPWNWDLEYFNAVEIWTRGWRSISPIFLEEIADKNKERIDGQLTKSIAIAAATRLKSGNGQSTLFYDLELSRGIKAGIIAGSRSKGPSTPLGSPVTYVYAREQSLLGILEGLRLGRTYVSSGLDGPTIEFIADIMGDGLVDVSIGGTIPVDVVTRFTVNIRNAKGKRFELLMNGHPSVSTMIKEDNWNFSTNQKPDGYSVFRCRVSEVPTTPGYGIVNVLAMTSPIYAQGILLQETPSGVDAWMRIENDRINAEDSEAFIKYLENQSSGQSN